MKKIFAGIFVLICALSLFACDFSSTEQFGTFTHNGYALTTFKRNDISYLEAKSLIQSNHSSTYVSLISFGDVLTDSEITSIKKMYKSVTITVKYWNDDKQYTKVDEVEISEMEKMLKDNTYTVVTGMVVNNIVLTPDLLEYYNNLNDEFINSSNYDDAPFKNKYSYHTDSNEFFVLRVNDYSDNDSDITGTSTFEIHETESQYDENNMIVKYQASFGFSYPTPGGTEHIGTVLEVEFNWNIKS